MLEIIRDIQLFRLIGARMQRSIDKMSSCSTARKGLSRIPGIFLSVLFLCIVCGCDYLRIPKLGTLKPVSAHVKVLNRNLVCTGVFGPDSTNGIAYVTHDLSQINVVSVLSGPATAGKKISLPFIGKVYAPRGLSGSETLLADDLDGDGRDEILVGITDGHKHIVGVYQPGEVAPVFQSEPIELIDRNGDGLVDAESYSFVVEQFLPGHDRVIVTSVRTGFDLEPRGIYVFSIDTGELLWEFHTGGWPVQAKEMLIEDFDRDGFNDLLLGVESVANGHEANGMRDDHQYVACISGAKRSLLWKREISNNLFSRMTFGLHDFDGDGTGEVFAGELRRVGGMRSVVACICNARDGSIEDCDTINALSGFMCKTINFNQNHPGNPVILAGMNGSFYEISFARKRLAVKEHRGIISLLSGDVLERQLWGDERPELLISGSGGCMVFDTDLNTIYTYYNRDKWNLDIRSIDTIALDEMLVIAVVEHDQHGRYLLYCLALQPVAGSSFSSSLAGIAPVALICFGSVLWAAALFRRRPDWNGNRERESFKWTEIGSCLLPLWTIISVADRECRVGSGKRGLIPSGELRDAVNGLLANRLLRRKSFAKLRDHMGQLISVLGDSRDAADVEALRASACCHARIIAEGMGVNPVHIIRSVCKSRSGRMSELGVRLERFSIQGRINAHVLMGEGDLRWIMEELLDNALKAMEEAAERALYIDIKTRTGFIDVIVSDTGEGILDGMKDKIFAMGESGRTGGNGGYGLFRVRSIVRGWGGDVFVSYTEKSVGTQMICRLLAPSSVAFENEVLS